MIHYIGKFYFKDFFKIVTGTHVCQRQWGLTTKQPSMDVSLHQWMKIINMITASGENGDVYVNSLLCICCETAKRCSGLFLVYLMMLITHL
jgi:hypothetical protein